MAHCATQPGIYWTAASASSLQTCMQGQLQKPILLLKPIHQLLPFQTPSPQASGQNQLCGPFVYFQPTKTLVRPANGFIPDGMLKMLVTQDCSTTV